MKPARTARLALLLLQGCSGLGAGLGLAGDSVYGVRQYVVDPGAYLFADGHATRNVATYIAGNPFGVPPAQLAATVAAAMDSAIAERLVHFVVRRGEPVRQNMTMVVVFDPAPGVTAAGMCRRLGAVSTRPRRGAIEVAMAFCLAKGPASLSQARIERGRRLGDPALVLRLREMTESLFGREDTLRAR